MNGPVELSDSASTDELGGRPITDDMFFVDKPFNVLGEIHQCVKCERDIETGKDYIRAVLNKEFYIGHCEWAESIQLHTYYICNSCILDMACNAAMTGR